MAKAIKTDTNNVVSTEVRIPLALFSCKNKANGVRLEFAQWKNLFPDKSSASAYDYNKKGIGPSYRRNSFPGD